MNCVFGTCLETISFTYTANGTDYLLGCFGFTDNNIIMGLPNKVCGSVTCFTQWDFDTQKGILFLHGTQQALYFKDENICLTTQYSDDPKFQGWTITNGVISNAGRCVSLVADSLAGPYSLLAVPSSSACTVFKI
jgi:hypothetical protein